jgi:superoxide dismutase
MRYSLKQIHCRPWTLSYLSVKLIESHYENNYGGALRRLNAITEQLESLDFATTPGHVLNGLKREEMVALNSTLLHELYFASMGGDGQPTKRMTEILARDFGSLERWRTEFSAMGYALGGGSGWVLLTYVPRDGRLINQYAADHSQSVAGAVPILALDMYEHAYHMDFGANARAYVDTFLRNVDWPALELRYEDAARFPGPRPLEQPEFGDCPRHRRGGSARDDRGRQTGPGHRRAPARRGFAAAGHRRGRHVARSRAIATMDRRAVEIGAGGRVLRVRLPRGLQDHRQAARGRLRREVHEQRTLGVEGDRRARAAAHVRRCVGPRVM